MLNMQCLCPGQLLISQTKRLNNNDIMYIMSEIAFLKPDSSLNTPLRMIYFKVFDYIRR